jgi:site-specific DNA-methyltransferase (adenine-specific)
MSDITLYNEDCFITMANMIKTNTKVNTILTSPPYNTARPVKTQKAIDTYNNRYDIYIDAKTTEEYGNWTLKLFESYDKVLKPNGIVLYNISYGSERPDDMWNAVAKLILESNFMIAEQIIWKKKSALPNNVSPNKLTRICEPVFVFCRKNEYKTYAANKKVKSIRKDTGQKYYENIFNFIEAANNDGPNKLNKATFSTDLCKQLLSIYSKEGDTVYDSFMGTGTTAVACKEMNINCIGSELSEAQYNYSLERLNN